jgi:hypothetical protein
MTGAWLDRVRGTQVLDVAQRLGLTVWPRRGASGGSMQCPACKALRRHTKSEDKRGAFGVRREGDGGRCWQCEASGDAVDVVSLFLTGRRYRDADPAQRAEVRAWFDDTTGPAPAPILAPMLPPLDFPPELRAFFESLVRAEDDPEAAAYLRGRGIDPTELERRKLGAVLQRGVRVPIWGRLGDLRWSDTGHRLIVPLVDAHAIARSCVARSVTAHPGPRKSLAPQNHTRRGLVLANALARHVLATGEFPQGYPRPFRVVITEGEIDFLTAACEEPEATGPMVLGVFTGSWSPELAARIPDAHVIIATDNDDAGDKFAALIAASLEGRNVTLLRWAAS